MMSPPHSDIDFAMGDLPIRQGDIFAWRGWKQNDAWTKYGLVVTADCDIAQNKSHSNLSYVPLLQIASYIEQFWARRKLDRLLSQRTADAVELIHRQVLQISPNATRLTPEVLHRWVQSRTSDQICDELRISDAKDRRRFAEKHCAPLQMLLRASSDGTEISAVQTLCGVRKLLNGDQPAKILEQAADELANQLPQDCFFLSGVPGDESSRGLFAMLRYVRATPISSIAATQTDFRDGPYSGIRVGRLASPFKFALMQQFSLLFSRVGLPDSHDELLASTIRDVCTDLGTKMNGASNG